MAELGDRVGKYHVLARLAQGGMAEIYKAKSVGIAGFEKILALKRIHPNFASEPRFIRSFIDEARIAVTLNHRNIVQVFDFGKAGDELYLAMELIDGADLRTILARAMARANPEPVPVPVVCFILADVAAGLDYAHRKTDADGNSLGIVHCDVSPQNVMLSSDGFVKILDFGVARARFSTTPHEKRLRGKPRYMAPEQTRGEPPVPATDVFALGIVAWELLTGRALFTGPDLQAILAAVRRADAPPVASLNPEVPVDLSDAVARALDPDPARRGTAGELSAILGRTARELSQQTGVRTLADWLERVDPRLDGDPTESAARRPASEGEVPTGTHTVIIEDDAAGSDSDGDGDDEAEPTGNDLAALLEQRRAVATTVIIEGGTDDSRRELGKNLAELSYKHGAVVHSATDDTLTALFGLEVAGEDDIAAAMHFALDAVDLARESAAAEPAAASLALRLGTRAGVVVQRDGSAFRVRGDTLGEAAALAAGAEPGRPLLTGGTGRLASAQFEFRELAARRHRSRRLRVLELVGRRGFAERTRALRERRGRFVERDVQLAALLAALARASRGDRAVVAVMGPAGIGKSRLIAEFAARAAARSRPPRQLAVAASPGARDAPFSLVTELFQSALDLPPGRGESARASLTRRLRFVLDRGGVAASARDEAIAAVDRAMELRDGALTTESEAPVALRERVVAALGLLLRALYGDRLLLAVVDDMHLADATSAQVLATALAQPGSRELWLLSTRDGDGLPDGADVVALDELGGAGRTALIRDRLAEAARDDTVAVIARRAGGNPLFIEELATCVRELGDSVIPPTVRDVLLARVDSLSKAAKTTLQYAAVAGPVFRSPILEEILGPRVSRHLQELADEGLVTRADFVSAEVDEGELAFRHGVLQEAMYESLTAAARRQTHARIGRILALRLDAGREEPPAAVARHLELGGEHERAAVVWLRAGHVAVAADDAAAARAAFERVLELDAASTGSAALMRREAARAALAGLAS